MPLLNEIAQVSKSGPVTVEPRPSKLTITRSAMVISGELIARGMGDPVLSVQAMPPSKEGMVTLVATKSWVPGGELVEAAWELPAGKRFITKGKGLTLSATDRSVRDLSVARLTAKSGDGRTTTQDFVIRGN
jgi:hypothetical protein